MSLRQRRSFMKENELSVFGKVAVVLLLVMGLIVPAVRGLAKGEVQHSWAFWLVIVGFLLFVVAKLSAMYRTQWISVGSHRMTNNMANLYRLGYWLMAVGTLLTFTP